MTPPVININGSDPWTLMADHVTALDAVRTAIKVVGHTAPHGRDYPVPGSLACAQRDHQARMKMLEIVFKEINEVIEHISNSEMERAK